MAARARAIIASISAFPFAFTDSGDDSLTGRPSLDHGGTHRFVHIEAGFSRKVSLLVWSGAPGRGDRGAQRKQVAVYAEAADLAPGDGGDHRVGAECFARMDVGHV